MTAFLKVTPQRTSPITIENAEGAFVRPKLTNHVGIRSASQKAFGHLRSNCLISLTETKSKVSIMEVRDATTDERYIELSVSEWLAPVVMVQKKDSSRRFAVNYRNLEQITKPISYSPPGLRMSFTMSFKSKQRYLAPLTWHPVSVKSPWILARATKQPSPFTRVS